MASNYVNPNELAVLWGRAGASCSICRKNLLEDLPKSGRVNLGERAHIIPRRASGPRGDGTSHGPNTYDNLILLCACDHLMVDKGAKDYPRKRLLNIKKEHEWYVRNSIDNAEKEKLESAIGSYLAEPQISLALTVGGGHHRSFIRIVPRFIQEVLGGVFGYHKVYITLNNVGSKRADKVTLAIYPVRSTFPPGYTFSRSDCITSDMTPSSICKESSYGSLNVGEIKTEFFFYLNYRRGAGDNISDKEDIIGIEFEYYLTCDDTVPSKGKIKIANT